MVARKIRTLYGLQANFLPENTYRSGFQPHEAYVHQDKLPYLDDTPGHSCNKKTREHPPPCIMSISRHLREDVQQSVGHPEAGSQHGCETNLRLDGRTDERPHRRQLRSPRLRIRVSVRRADKRTPDTGSSSRSRVASMARMVLTSWIP